MNNLPQKLYGLRKSKGLMQEELAEALGAEVLHEGDIDHEVEGVYVGDQIGRAAGRIGRGSAWVTIMRNVNVAAAAEISGAACVFLAESVQPDDELKERLKFISASVLKSADSAYVLAWKIHQVSGL